VQAVLEAAILRFCGVGGEAGFVHRA